MHLAQLRISVADLIPVVVRANIYVLNIFVSLESKVTLCHTFYHHLSMHQFLWFVITLAYNMLPGVKIEIGTSIFECGARVSYLLSFFSIYITHQ